MDTFPLRDKALTPRLDFICLTVFDVNASTGHVASLPKKTFGLAPNTKVIRDVPQLYWSNKQPWHEANLWAYERAVLVHSGQLNISTIQAALASLRAYMCFLENSSLDWRYFPKAKADRCLTQFRGELIRARNAGELSASTASGRMAATIRFYRWVKANSLLETEWEPFDERIIHLKVENSFGLERSVAINSTDLSIPNRRRSGLQLEDGLKPVSLDERDWILSLAKTHAPEEFRLMLTLGFGTGMRLGSICDLKLKTILRARPHPSSDQLYYLAIGPGIHSAPVHTKFGVTGEVIIPSKLLHELRHYINSPRRLTREARAASADKELIFLTRFGKSYGRQGQDRSSSVNVEISRLKKVSRAKGKDVNGFHFHSSRATFATSVADTALRMGGTIKIGNIVSLIRDLLLHKDEATSLKYIKFVRDQRVKAKWADEFTQLFVAAPRSGNTELGNE